MSTDHITTFRGEFFDSELERISYIDGWFSGVHIGCVAMLEHIVKFMKLSPEEKEKFENAIADVIDKIGTK